MSEKMDGFEELVKDVALELENEAIVRITQTATKAAYMASVLYKESREWGLPRKMCEMIAADLWRVLVSPPEDSDDPDDEVCV